MVWAKRKMLQDYGGIIFTDSDHIVVFDSHNAKSAELNTVDFSRDKHDTRCSERDVSNEAIE